MAVRKLDPRGRAVVIALTAAQGVIGTLTVRDISKRPAERVRGPKLFWKIWGGTNAVGSAAYWLIGRRK